MTKRICNWCARVSGSDPESNEIWIRADLRIEGLDDGSISWLPSKVLDFCTREECGMQVERVEDFLLGMPRGTGGILVRFVVSDTSDGVSFYEERSFDHPDAAEDVRAMARFFNETSHPKLRAKLEAFEETST